jgi:hypothetical protein
MRKTLLSLLTLLTMGYVAQAQVSIIPKMGLTISDVAYKEKQEGQKSVSGLLFGAGFNFPLVGEVFSIQPELLYIQKGVAGVYSDADQGVTMDMKIHTNYLEVPLLAKVAFGSQSVKAYLNVGPSFGYGLGGNVNYKANIMGFPIEGTGKIKFGETPEDASEEDMYIENRIDLGLQFGGGLAFKAGPGSILLDARYGYGMSNLSNDDSNSGDNKSQNRVIAISLGYAIPLGDR